MAEFRAMRRFKQELTKEECVRVLVEAPRGILSLNGENGYPYSIPINQFYDEEDGKLYFHGAKQGLKLELIQENNKACFTAMDNGFARPGEWALNIKSVICLGHIEILEDHEKIIDQCRNLARKFYPDEASIDEEIRKAGPRVNMLVMTIDRMTGKLVNES